MNIFNALEQVVIEGGIENGVDIPATIDFDVRDPYVYIRFPNGKTIAISEDGTATFL